MLALPVLEILVFSLALWFGLYLLARDFSRPGQRYAGLGLVAYALGLALDVLQGTLAQPATWIDRLRWPLLFLPALFWFGATVHLLPGELPGRTRLIAFLNGALVMCVIILYSAALIVPAPDGPVYWLLTAGVALLLAVALGSVWQAYRANLPKRPLGLLLVASLFFALGMGMILLPSVDWFTPQIELLMISVDLIVLGAVIVALDAFDAGEALLPDVLRSLGASVFMALLFGGQVVLVMRISRQTSPELILLLLALIATAIFTQTFADPLQATLDQLILARFPRLRRERADLRAAASAAARLDDTRDVLRMEDAEFIRLTRRALSHLGDLNRLAASPLTRLPIIDSRLNQQGKEGTTLERAAELKALLSESIHRLRPRDGSSFGTSDAWRYYNALYFPYVVGLKPYSRRADHDGLDPAADEALQWFQTYVPERTLHNWQNAAARLVAQDLRDRLD